MEFGLVAGAREMNRAPGLYQLGGVGSSEPSPHVFFLCHAEYIHTMGRTIPIFDVSMGESI